LILFNIPNSSNLMLRWKDKRKPDRQWTELFPTRNRHATHRRIHAKCDERANSEQSSHTAVRNIRYDVITISERPVRSIIILQPRNSIALFWHKYISKYHYKCSIHVSVIASTMRHGFKWYIYMRRWKKDHGVTPATRYWLAFSTINVQNKIGVKAIKHKSQIYLNILLLISTKVKETHNRHYPPTKIPHSRFALPSPSTRKHAAELISRAVRHN
jgi:hypothetical protein